eukprot:768587-Hanusia_phi.AAC.3
MAVCMVKGECCRIQSAEDSFRKAICFPEKQVLLSAMMMLPWFDGDDAGQDDDIVHDDIVVDDFVVHVVDDDVDDVVNEGNEGGDEKIGIEMEMILFPLSPFLSSSPFIHPLPQGL